MSEKPLSTGHSRRDVLRYAAASSIGLALPATVAVAPDGTSASSGVSGPLRSGGALTFGANNVLFVADIKGAKIHAFALRDQDLTSQTDIISGNFDNFEGRDHVVGVDQKLAALFGTTIDKIVINDMVVHQATQQIFLSVERGRGPDAAPAIVRVNHGKLEILELDRIPHSQISVPNEPDAKDMLEFEPQQVYANYGPRVLQRRGYCLGDHQPALRLDSASDSLSVHVQPGDLYGRNLASRARPV